MKLYTMHTTELIELISTNSTRGLSQHEATERLKNQGPNSLPEKKPRGWHSIFIDQFKSPLIYVLVCAAVIIFFVGDTPHDAFIITAVLLFNAIIGTIQEGRTANIVEALKRYTQTSSVVIRDGLKLTIPDTTIVIGDLIILSEGQRIPADIRIIESNSLQIDQSILTGESKPVRKNAEAIDADCALMQQQNMLFKGTLILNGSGKGIVVATGLNTEIGKIHTAIQTIETDIPLRKDIEKLAYSILLVILAICSVLFGIGITLGKPIQTLITMLTALFICVVPEGLPVVLTLILVSGVYRMARRNVLVKNMQAVETLGRTDILVVDKTGTLTRNEMMVSRVWSAGTLFTLTGEGYHAEGYLQHNGQRIKTDLITEQLSHTARASILLNGSELSYDTTQDIFTVKGDPTEAALGIFGTKIAAIKALSIDTYIKIAEEPFSAHARFHTGIFTTPNNQKILYAIGAPEIIMAASEKVSPEVQHTIDNLLKQGFRVVCCGYRIIEDTESISESVKNLHNLNFATILGIEDALREGISTIIAQARYAGLKVVMATGDHQTTAEYIAQRADIIHTGDLIIDGSRLASMTDEELAACIDRVSVFSRVTPLYKMRIIQAFHQKGHIVAMTGDGTNDAPSLVAADLGIGMGHIGTEVAKEASDIILLDDSLASILTAIKQGRHILYTLKRVILYFFATNLGEIMIILYALLYEIMSNIALPLPISAAQILWLNLVTDGFLDIALSMEPEEPDLLNRDWLSKRPQLIDRTMVGLMIFYATLMSIGSLWVFLHTYKINIRYAQTMTLITMAMYQWFNAWNCRSRSKPFFKIGFFSNKWLLAATSFVLLLQLAVVYVPFMQKLFNTTSLALHDWFLVLAVSVPILIIEEIRKFVVHIKLNQST